MAKQTAGHDLLGDFAPQFAELNDDVLFGEVWSKESELSAHDRSLITIASIISAGNLEQLDAHDSKIASATSYQNLWSTDSQG